MPSRCGSFPVARASLLAALLVLSGLASATQDEAADFFEDALRLFNQGDYPAAVIQLRNTIRANPNHISAHVVIGNAYLKQGEGAAAEDALRSAQELGADPVLTAVPLAKAFLQQLKHTELLDTPIPTELPAAIQAELMVLRGKAHLGMRELEEAERTFLEAAELDPGSPDPINGQATVLLRRGEIAAAEHMARKAMARTPKGTDTWSAMVMAAIGHAKGDLEAAIDHYDAVLAIEEAHLDARLGRAGARMELGRDSEAAADLAYLEEAFGGEPRVIYLRGLLAARRKDREGLEEAMRDAVTTIESLKPTILNRRPQLILLAGLAYYRLGQYERARPYLKRHVQRSPKQVGARKILGSVLLALGEPDEAIEVLQPVQESAGNDPRIANILGIAYMQQGQLDLAATMLEKAASLAPETPEIRTRLALSHLAAGNQTLAMEDLIAVLDNDPGNATAGLVLAVMHLKRGELRQAMAAARHLVERHPQDLTALNLLASAQVAAGERRRARVNFEKAISINPEFLPARINLGKLDALERRYGDAKRRFLSILKERPRHVRTLIELASLAETQKRVHEAARWLEMAAGAELSETGPLLRLVELHLKSGNAEAALAAAERANDRKPEDIQVLTALGRSHLAKGEKNLARVVFQRMAVLASFDAAVLFQIARHQMTAGALRDAAWTLQKAVSGDSGHLPSLITLAEVQLRLGNIKNAQSGALVLREKYPQRADGYRLLGDVLMRREAYAEALESYREALAREDSARLAIARFRAQRLAEDAVSAIATLEEWARAHPERPLAKEALAEAHLADGNLVAARKQYEQLLDGHGDSPTALNNLAYISAKLGTPGALSYAKRAHELAPNDPAINDTLGWLLVRSGEPALGLQHLRQAHARAAGSAEIRYHIAVALVKLNRPEEAKQELAQALQGKDEFDSRTEAQALLRELSP